MFGASSSNVTGPVERCPGTERWGRWPSPVGLTLGILAVFAFQVVVVGYHYARLRWCATRRVQLQPRPLTTMWCLAYPPRCTMQSPSALA